MIRDVARTMLEILLEGPHSRSRLLKKVGERFPQYKGRKIFTNVLNGLIASGIVEMKPLLCYGTVRFLLVLNEDRLRDRWWLRPEEL